MRCLHFFLLILGITCSNYVHSEYIVQIDVKQSGVVDRVFIKLLEADSPLTVQNFRNYISDGDYVHSFIHRSMPGFIVQGGGFSFDKTLNDGTFSYDAVNDLYPGGLQLIPKDAAVVNEFGNSNVRGTLAMAKLSFNPDSATSQWFVNLADNSANLDNQNGGFTVFAEVLGNGMDVFDAIAAQPVFNRTDIHPAYADLPLVDFLSDPVTEANLVVTSFAEVLSISPDINYGIVTQGSNLQPEIVIVNTSNVPVTIGDIGVQDSLAEPFRIVGDLCSNQVLAPGKRCSLIALFSPVATSVYQDSFDIAFPDLGLNYSVQLSGEGGGNVDEADITTSFSSVDFLALDVLYRQDIPPYSKKILINNFGALPLELNSIVLSAASDVEFSLAGNCLTTSVLATNEFCILDILYLPRAEGGHSATVVIGSNDPDESTFEIPVFAVALGENDGVDAVIEDAASNGGDGNNDDIPDSQQSYVTSLPDQNGAYVTYISTIGRPYSNVSIVNESTLNLAAANDIDLSAGIHEFTVENIQQGAIVDIGILLPANAVPLAYYIFGPTADNQTPHWYTFSNDNETGASFIGVARLASPGGRVVDKNVISLKLKNGGRGDSSGESNNLLVVKGAIKYRISSDSGGGLSLLFLLMLLPPVLFYRIFRLLGH